ncbi:MAG: type II toxin-antitoxin system VapC family toxin [Chloroflexi bacterium]|nr:type II toxin-antitoxin system VapC family toxin [Chloroflexota bacterium]
MRGLEAASKVARAPGSVKNERGAKCGQCHAAYLLEETELLEPRLLYYELSNAAQKKVLRKLGGLGEVLDGLRLIRQLNIRWIAPDRTESLASLALKLNISAYDASYIQVALAMDAELVTFDERLAAVYRALKRSG